ncbi:MAG: T9SS type A sorting domain-containing protein [Bacteroidetes bacterium]|nr:T9SS type A sorting domain-containing protein [Bacteroidota bacterium]
MKTSILLKSLALILLTLNLNGNASAGVIPVSNGYSTKYLYASAESKMNSVSDGTIICWLEDSFRGSLEIQKLGIKGEKLWIENGLIVDKDLGRFPDPDTDFPLVFSDNSGGAVVIYRKVFYQEEEIYCAKISSEGEVIRKVCLSSRSGGYNFSPAAAVTADNCIAVVWENFISGDFDIQGQKIDLNCNKLWNNGDEVTVCGQSDDQRKPYVMCDRKGQLLISWLDTRISLNSSEFGYDLYANKIDENGEFTNFGNSGKLIMSFPSHGNSVRNNKLHYDENAFHGKSPASVRKAMFYNHNMIHSDNNSAITAVDIRDLETDSYISVFKINENLDVVWNRDIEAESFQQNPLITSDGSEGAVIVWNDLRNGGNSIYGMRINGSGNVISAGDNGLKVSFDSGKKNSVRLLPDKRNMSGLLFRNNKVFIPWTVSDSRDLFLACFDLSAGSQYRLTPELITNGISDANCISVLSSNGERTVVFSKENTIFASAENYEEKVLNIKSKHQLNLSNYPNPFNPVTKISYELSVPGFVNVKIFDMAGRIVNEPVNEFQNAGRHERTFDGNSLSSGLYFCRIVSGDYSETMRMTLLK